MAFKPWKLLGDYSCIATLAKELEKASTESTFFNLFFAKWGFNMFQYWPGPAWWMFLSASLTSAAKVSKLGRLPYHGSFATAYHCIENFPDVKSETESCTARKGPQRVDCLHQTIPFCYFSPFPEANCVDIILASLPPALERAVVHAWDLLPLSPATIQFRYQWYQHWNCLSTDIINVNTLSGHDLCSSEGFFGSALD